MAIYAKVDCGLPRDPKLVTAGPLPRLLYIQFVLYCRENLTDGVLDAVLLPLVALDIPHAKKHIAALVAVGAIEVDERGWRIPTAVWAKWNPTKAEVDDMRKVAADRKASWRDKQKRDADVPAGQVVARQDRDTQPEGETETEGKGEHDSVNRQQQQTRVPDRAALISQATEVIIGRRNIADRSSAYIAATRKGITTDLGEWACARKLDGYTPERLAQEYEPTAGAGSTLREIRGVLHRHVAGTGFVPITPAASDDAWLEEEVSA